MKTGNKILLVLIVMLTCVSVYAQEAIQPDFEWMKEALAILKGIPYVGPFVKMALEISMSVVAFLTGLVGVMKGIVGILRIVAKKANVNGLENFALMLEQKIIPKIAKFSAFNVKEDGKVSL